MFGNVTELKDLALPPMDEIKKYKAVDSRRKNMRDDFLFNSKDVDKLLATIPVDPKERKYAYEVVEFNAIMESLSKMISPTRRWTMWDAWNSVTSAVLHYGSIAADAAITFLSDAADTIGEFVHAVITPFWPFDSDYYRGREDSADAVNMEYNKLEKFDKLMVCLLIHTRYRVDHAIRQRNEWCHVNRGRRAAGKGEQEERKSVYSKNYRLGYLFNRLRRVKYFQARAVNTANLQRIASETVRPAFNLIYHNYGWQVVRWYEKMIHLDQDIRDLCSLIYDTLDEVAPEPNWNPRQLELKMLG